MKKVSKLFIVLFLILSFAGCTKYHNYYTRGITKENISLKNKIPVKMLVTSNKDSFSGVGLQRLKDDIQDLLNESDFFVEDPTSETVLKIDVHHIDEENASGVTSAVFTGLTLGIVPSVTDRETIITIQLKEIQYEYIGTRMISTIVPDMDKFSEGYSSDLLKHLVENALNEFIEKYYKTLKE